MMTLKEARWMRHRRRWKDTSFAPRSSADNRWRPTGAKAIGSPANLPGQSVASPGACSDVRRTPLFNRSNAHRWGKMCFHAVDEITSSGIAFAFQLSGVFFPFIVVYFFFFSIWILGLLRELKKKKEEESRSNKRITFPASFQSENSVMGQCFSMESVRWEGGNVYWLFSPSLIIFPFFCCIYLSIDHD